MTTESRQTRVMTRDEIVVSRNWEMRGPRWDGIPAFVMDAARDTGVRLDRFVIDKGWLTTTVFFDVSGPLDRMERFRSVMRASVDKYSESD